VIKVPNVEINISVGEKLIGKNKLKDLLQNIGGQGTHNNTLP